MEQFFIRVLTAVFSNPEVHKAMQGLMKEAVKEGTEALKETVDTIASEVPKQLDSIEKNAINNLDSMDGKVGNLQEQLTNIPGQIIRGILDPLQELLKNPLGGLFGQR